MVCIVLVSLCLVFTFPVVPTHMHLPPFLVHVILPCFIIVSTFSTDLSCACSGFSALPHRCRNSEGACMWEKKRLPLFFNLMSPLCCLSAHHCDLNLIPACGRRVENMSPLCCLSAHDCALSLISAWRGGIVKSLPLFTIMSLFCCLLYVLVPTSLSLNLSTPSL